MWKWPKKLWEEEKHLAILIDYENVSLEAAIKGKILDFERIRDICLEIGIIDFAYIFAPTHMISYRLPEYIHNKGFDVIACPFSPNNGERSGEKLKDKDRVDMRMIETGWRLINRARITHLVIVTHDGDFVTLVNHATSQRKKVFIIAGENISCVLKEAVGASNVFPLPLKDKNGN